MRLPGGMMYIVAVKREFIAQHYLVGGDWGDENEEHSHHYQVELQLSGNELDQHGYLIDIVDIEKNLEETISEYRDKLLNEQDEFKGINPSIEHFARILCQQLSARILAVNVRTITVQVWENEIAWTSFSMER